MRRKPPRQPVAAQFIVLQNPPHSTEFSVVAAWSPRVPAALSLPSCENVASTRLVWSCMRRAVPSCEPEIMSGCCRERQIESSV